MTPDEYLKRPYSWCFVPDRNGSYSAYIREFPGCITEGRNFCHAKAMLFEVALEWISIALDLGQDIPEPLESAWRKL